MYKEKTYLPIIMLVCVVLVFAVIVAAYFLKSNGDDFEESADQNVTDLKLELISETEIVDMIEVETNWDSFKFSYPVAYSEIIKVNVVNQSEVSRLQFYTKTDDGEILTYTICFNSDEGIPCGKLNLSEDYGELGVSVLFEDAPETLSSDWLSAFNAVQETFNDVVTSMSEDSRFTSVE